MADPRSDKRDLVLPPGTYAFIQDQTQGALKICTGPTTITPSQSDVPVLFDETTNSFKRCEVLDQAVRPNAFAPEGSYIVLRNPARGGQPRPGMKGTAAEYDLRVGSRSVIPGPVEFPLWPQQSAEAIRGHHLRSNQYLKIRVYNEDEAKSNWAKAVMRPVVQTSKSPDDAAPPIVADGAPAGTKDITVEVPKDITVGRVLIIKGTEVSFYIPPPGIEVLRNEDTEADDEYVHDALTLESLEYAILIDENGKKRYEYGPAVVFPTPTETFISISERTKDGKEIIVKKFRAIELNEIQGIHVKVIADYVEENGIARKAGEELFITGKDTQIYYPRSEHSAIKYDGKVKSFATAVPAGEARYVLNRQTGAITKVPGPAMLLPDPRNSVIVRRVLSDKQVQLWYPNNAEALAFNQYLRTLQPSTPTTRSGVVSEGEVERASKGIAARTRDYQKQVGGDAAPIASAGVYANRLAAASTMSFMESSGVSKDQNLVGDEFARHSTYTAPRTVTLDTKYHGAPLIEVWSGYAVMVVSKDPNAPIRRRVVKGPEAILLDYHEVLEVLTFSTGKPKTTDAMERSVYLRVENNKVADKVKVETTDHVGIELYVSYKVNFTGVPERWFSVENYVKYLCDHVRSVLKGAIRKMKVEEFYADATGIIRNIILGPITDGARSGLVFAENGMRVDDVEVLEVTITDASIQALLLDAQRSVVRTSVELTNQERALEVNRRKESIAQEELAIRATTTKVRLNIEAEIAAAQIALALDKAANRLKELAKGRQIVELEEAEKDFVTAAERERAILDHKAKIDASRLDQEIELKQLAAEVDAVIRRFQAAQGGLSEALLAMSNNETMTRLAEAWSIQRVIGGENVSDAIRRIFAGTPLEATIKRFITDGAPDTK